MGSSSHRPHWCDVAGEHVDVGFLNGGGDRLSRWFGTVCGPQDTPQEGGSRQEVQRAEDFGGQDVLAPPASVAIVAGVALPGDLLE